MAALSKTYNSIGRSSQAPAGVDQSQWSANPYAQFDYRHTWWQKLWEGLGFRSKFDEYRDSMALNAAEYDAQLAEKAHNEQYDSPAEQNARLRAAGINPDLAGDTSSGASSPMQPDPNAPISPGFNDPVPALQGFVNTVMSAFTGAIGLAKDGLSLFQMRNDVEGGNIANSQSIFDYAMAAARQFIPSAPPSSDDPGWMSRAIDQAFDSTAGFMSSRQRRQFRRALTSFYQSAPTQADQWQSWINMMDAKIEGKAKQQSKFFGDGTDEVLEVVTRPLTRLFDRIREASLGSQAAAVENEQAYQEAIDPSLQASVENMSNRRNLASADIDAILNSALDDIISGLSDLSHSNKPGHGLASAAVLMFSLLRLVNFSSHRSSGMTPKGPMDVSTSSFGF